MEKQPGLAKQLLPALRTLALIRAEGNPAIQRRLPLMTADRAYAEAGFLMSYGTPRGEVLRLTAVFVDKILRGAKPADLPVEQPSRLELVVNLATAKTLGLNIPPGLLLQAEQVIN